jgi:hypothetical protein
VFVQSLVKITTRNEIVCLESWKSAKDETGAYLIDRSPDYFAPLLNYLRHGKLILNDGVNPIGVLEEAKFFGLTGVAEQLEEIVKASTYTFSRFPSVTAL